MAPPGIEGVLTFSCSACLSIRERGNKEWTRLEDGVIVSAPEKNKMESIGMVGGVAQLV